jgi:arginyl-tRNA synthetase
VQYAHARIASILREAAERPRDIRAARALEPAEPD